MKTRALGYTFAIIGGLWVASIIALVSRNIILRDTWLAVFAKFLDLLPSPFRGAVFICLWILFFTGWVVPLYLAIRNLAGTADSGRQSPTANDKRQTTQL